MCAFTEKFHPISWIRKKIILLDIKWLPSITGYENEESNTVVLGSNNVAVILIQRQYMCDFTVNLSPNLVNKDKKWLYLQQLVLE